MVLCEVANRAGESCAALRSISRDAKCIGMGRMGKNYGRMKKCSITDSTVLLREYGLPIGLLSFFAPREPSFKVVAQFEYCRSSIREASSITTSSVSHYLSVYELIIIHE